MSGLKRRLSRRRSAGPEGSEPSAAAPGPEEAPNQTPTEAEGRTSLLSDPAAPTRVLQPGDAPTQPGPAQAAPYAAGQPAEGAARHGGEASPHAATPGEPYAEGARHAGDQPHAGYPDAPYAVGEPYPPAEPAQPVADLPPGLDPDELAAVPTSSARRGRLRRRVAFLRAARELLLRDLGGFVYELHRTAGDIEHEAHRRLRATKLARLTRIDNELHELELRLDDVRRNVVVREPGVGGECPECGELFGSDDHYCSNCGLPLTESARRAVRRAAIPEAAVAPALVAGEPATPAEASFTGLRPATGDQPTQELQPPTGDAPAEFRWPSRPGASDDESTGNAAGTEATGAHETTDRGDDRSATSVGEEAAAASGDVPPAAGEATASGDDPATTTADESTGRGDEPASAADGGDLSAQRHGSATAAGEDANVQDDAAAEGEAAVRGDDPAAAAGGGEATGRSDDPAATPGSDEATGRGDDPAAAGGSGPAGSGQSAPSSGGANPNGRTPPSGDPYSRAERGT